jgi:hypothetical protein
MDRFAASNAANKSRYGIGAAVERLPEPND